MIRPPRKPLSAWTKKLRAIVDASDTPFAFAGMVKDRVLYGCWAAKMTQPGRDSTPEIVERKMLNLSCYVSESIPLNVVYLKGFDAIKGEHWYVWTYPREAIQDFDRSG
jgi:hypothetical protein